MPSRYYHRNFVKGYFYHIYNRGANKEKVFWDANDYQTFIDILAYYLIFPAGKPLSILNRTENKVPNLAENNTQSSSIILCEYCLMPNHFHLILKQNGEPSKEMGITNLMRRTTITYAMYIKEKYGHSGTLFQGKFKNVLVEKDSQLQELSKYVHRNPIKKQGSEPLQKYKYSSYKYFIGEELPPKWLDISPVLGQFSQKNSYLVYKKFVEETPEQFDKIKNIILE
jgi:putative transposase